MRRQGTDGRAVDGGGKGATAVRRSRPLHRAAFALLCLFSLLVSPTHGAPVPTATIGDPAKPDLLAQTLQFAYQTGARKITINPGVYLMPATGHATFVLDGWRDATISAYGVTIISSENAWNRDIFDVRHCNNVTLAGPILSQTAVTFYQGHVIAMGTDATSRAFCDWRPDVGYPIPPLAVTKFPGGANVVDAQTRRLKIGVGDFYDLQMEANGRTPERPQGDGTFRLQFHDRKVHVAVGDWIVGRYGEAPFKVFLDDSRNCTIRDVTMMRNGFSPLREDRGGGNHILHCHWTLGPPPGAAIENPLITNAADGFHSTGANPGPDIENCVFDGIFLDDCIAIHGDFQKVRICIGNTLIIENHGPAFPMGASLRIASDKGFWDTANITGVKDNGDKTSTLTLDKPLAIQAADIRVYDPRACGAGYRIEGCMLGETRSRGLLLKGDKGLVRNNTIVECGMSAVSIGPEFYWNEAGYVQNVRIVGNTFRGNGIAGYGGAAVFVHGDGAIGNSGIEIRDNHFYSSFQGDISLEYSDTAEIRGNFLSGGGIGGEHPGDLLHWPGWLPPPTPVTVQNSRGVTLTGNALDNPAAYKTPLLVVGPNVTGLKNDDPGGGFRIPGL